MAGRDLGDVLRMKHGSLGCSLVGWRGLLAWMCRMQEVVLEWVWGGWAVGEVVRGEARKCMWQCLLSVRTHTGARSRRLVWGFR